VAQTEHFHHLIYEVSDLERSEQFYGWALGLRPLGRDVWPEDGPTSAFELNPGQYIVLVENPERDRERSHSYTGLYLKPERWHDVCERLLEIGVTVREKKAGLHAVGGHSSTVLDPDGYTIELAANEPPVWEIPPAGRGKIDVGRVDDFAINSVTRFPEGKFFLVRFPVGFLALSEVCTHQQFTVTYQPEHYRFYCPLHRYRFTRDGRVLQRVRTVGEPPLHKYAIEFIDGHVIVDTDVSIPRTEDEARDVAAPSAGSLPARRE
jgi:catechol 2,3-dioxygenase-like lactoylglutathione lyase family enzyme/nitrite reductase/ring-hydroxylating ferredoxin subunit